MGEKTESKIKLEQIKQVLKAKAQLEQDITNLLIIFESQTGITIDKVDIQRVRTLATLGTDKLYADLHIIL